MYRGIEMENRYGQPTFLNIYQGEALRVSRTRYGEVGTLYSDDDIKAVWVSKHGEEIDPDWLSQEVVDLICLLQGYLKIEFESDALESRVLEAGDFMIMPPVMRCRAYR